MQIGSCEIHTVLSVNALFLQQNGNRQISQPLPHSRYNSYTVQQDIFAGASFRGIAPQSFRRCLIFVPSINLSSSTQLIFLQLVTMPMVFVFAKTNLFAKSAKIFCYNYSNQKVQSSTGEAKYFSLFCSENANQQANFRLTNNHISMLSEELIKALIPFEKIKISEELGEGGIFNVLQIWKFLPFSLWDEN